MASRNHSQIVIEEAMSVLCNLSFSEMNASRSPSLLSSLREVDGINYMHNLTLIGNVHGRSGK